MVCEGAYAAFGTLVMRPGRCSISQPPFSFFPLPGSLGAAISHRSLPAVVTAGCLGLDLAMTSFFSPPPSFGSRPKSSHAHLLGVYGPFFTPIPEHKFERFRGIACRVGFESPPFADVAAVFPNAASSTYRISWLPCTGSLSQPGPSIDSPPPPYSMCSPFFLRRELLAFSSNLPSI